MVRSTDATCDREHLVWAPERWFDVSLAFVAIMMDVTPRSLTEQTSTDLWGRWQSGFMQGLSELWSTEIDHSSFR